MYYFTIFLTCFILSICGTESKFVIDDKPSNTLIEYVKYVYTIYSKQHCGYNTVIINSTDNIAVDNCVQYFNSHAINTIFTLNLNAEDSQQHIHKIEKQNLYMGYLTIMTIFIESTTDLIPTLEYIQYTDVYITRCYILVILHEEEPPDTDALIQMFNQTWRKKILNIVVVFSEASDIRVFTYNPFLPTDQFLENLTDVRYDKHIYYDKTANVYGSPLRILILKDDDMTKIRKEIDNVTGVVTYKGKDIEMLRNIINKINATEEFLNSEDYLKPGERNPWRQTNNLQANTIEVKKRIITELRVDLLNTEELVLNKDMIGITESLYPHGKDDLYIIVHKSGKIPYYLYLFKVFKFELWCIAIFVFFVVVILWFCIVHFTKFCLWRVESLNILRVALNVSLPRLPLVSSERIYMIFWIFYSFIMAMAFQSNLTSILMEPKYYSDINTLEQFDASDLKIRAFRTIINEIDKALNGSSKHGIVKKMVAMPDSFDHAENSKNNFDAVFEKPVVLNYYRALYFSRQRKFYRNGRPILHLVKESPLPRYLAFQVSDGSPYFHVVNRLVRRFQETGFFIIWEKLTEHNDVIKKILIPADYSTRDRNSRRKNKITIYHLQTAFMNLFTGILLSFVVFIIEILIKYK